MRAGLSRLLLTSSLVWATVWGPAVWAKESAPRSSQEPVPLQALNSQAQSTYQLIRQGGPFPYEKDATVFGNRERLLPSQKRGYYREYTVPTPGLKHRGVQRIVCGGQVLTTPDACYYTADHYDSFRRIVP